MSALGPRLRQHGVVRLWAEPWSAEWVTMLDSELPTHQGWVELDALVLSWMAQRAFLAPTKSVLRPRTDAIMAEARALCLFGQGVIDAVLKRALDTEKIIEWNGRSAKASKPNKKKKGYTK